MGPCGWLRESRDLKEYTVGIEAFGKPPHYDPRLDSSVRVQAGKLRLRLDEYYRTEGVNDPVLVQLPKGRFRLEFHERSGSAKQAGVRQTGRNRLPWTIAGVAVLWAVVAMVFVVREKGPNPVSDRYRNPDVIALWSPFLQSKRPTIISLGTPVFAKISGDFFRSPPLNHSKDFAESADLKAIEKQLGSQAVPAYPYTGIGEASAAFELARLFLSRRRDINLLLSSALTWDDVARNEVIFLGPPKFNLYEFDLPVRQDFVIRHSGVENLHPKPGEPKSYRETWLAGQSYPAEGYAGELIRALRDAGNGIPKYFEVVVRAQFRSQIPIQIEQVALHVLR